MSETDEYLPIVAKLLDRTTGQKLEWQTYGTDSFNCEIEESAMRSFRFVLSKGESRIGETIFLTMFDPQRNNIFTARSTQLPTSPDEERLSDLLEALYKVVRRQALNIDEKLRTITDILDKT
jgi:hypothetical protein